MTNDRERAIGEELRTLILQQALPGEDDGALSVDDDLIGSGILDSLALVRLVTAVQERYGVALGPADVHPGNFRSARALAALVHARLAA